VERKSFREVNCSVAQGLELIGEWWTLLIIRDTFMGVTRFDDFQHRLGISRNVLNQRLTRLVDEGILRKVPYQDRPVRYDYRLTEKGIDLWPVITAIRQWGDKYAAPNGPPIQVVHKSCGHLSEAIMHCSACGMAMGARDVRAAPGPGVTTVAAS
jgi:DNA-binding HxlR family transcriptional regulator